MHFYRTIWNKTANLKRKNEFFQQKIFPRSYGLSALQKSQGVSSYTLPLSTTASYVWITSSELLSFELPLTCENVTFDRIENRLNGTHFKTRNYNITSFCKIKFIFLMIFLLWCIDNYEPKSNWIRPSFTILHKLSMKCIFNS